MNGTSTTHRPIETVADVPFGSSTTSRTIELFALFVALPLMLRWKVIAAPNLLILAMVTVGCVTALWRDPTFDRRRLFSLGGLSASLGTIALRAALVGAAILALVLVLRPPALLTAPGGASTPWLLGLAAYPFLSAWPQEVVYRVFFFHRYSRLFTSGQLVAVNAAAFGLLHIVYPNVVAPLVSIPAGLLLALTYRRTRTMGPVWLEHSVYGLLLFSLGLGGLFIDPVH